MTDRPVKRDWRTPVLLTLTVHLMVFTLFINHRLFSLIEPAPPGPYTMQVGELVGSDPEEDVQENDEGAAPGEEAATTGQSSASVSEAFDTEPTPEPTERPIRDKPVEAATDTPGEKEDNRSLSEKLQASVSNASSGGNGGNSVGAGGGAHGLRGEGKHGAGLARHGGSGETEDAVHLGLGWLAKVQDSDGRWDSDGYMLNYIPQATMQERYAEGVGMSRNDIGLTGLCMLAFTGAGYGDHDGAYKQTVKRAREFLLGKQRVVDGGFGLEADSFKVTMYAHSLATFAITDLYLVTGDETLRTPMRRALEYLLSMQGEGGGWDYDQRYPSQRDKYVPSTRDDLSISGWAIMALVAAREANFEIPPENLDRLAMYLRDCTRKDGDAVYADEGTRSGDRGKGMMAVSNVCRRLLGEPADSLTQQRQLKSMADTPPLWSDAGNVHGSTMYYWYYASIAMLLARDGDGGTDRWRQWNIALKKTLLDNQVKSGARRGSFDPVGHWARNNIGGRVYATAICVLNLEIYYRYEPEYLRVRASELGHLWDED
ncbi:MAG: hypothetical protein K8I27_15550 [Planctomycetes bacterium]|nr:hypothetical protein [Planctomycetota bacterium]